MYRLLLLNVLILLSFGCSSTAQQEANTTKSKKEITAKPIIHRVDVAKFESKMAEKDVVILDVRTPGEIKKGKIANALEIDYKSADFEQKIADLDKDKTYLVYCAAGGRSNRACRKMEDLGFTALYDLKSGYSGWAKAHSE